METLFKQVHIQRWCLKSSYGRSYGEDIHIKYSSFRLWHFPSCTIVHTSQVTKKKTQELSFKPEI